MPRRFAMCMSSRSRCSFGLRIRSWGHARRRLPATSVTYTTAPGQRTRLMLADGSQVTLSGASRLDVPTDYVTGHHTVWLVGEARFTVPHHAGTAFTVVSGPTITRVLGTSFLVRRYGADGVTLVTVYEGKVAIGATILSAPQSISVGTHDPAPPASQQLRGHAPLYLRPWDSDDVPPDYQSCVKEYFRKLSAP
jgi:ferric-dicitrate binding protein FerR (iron transport regulator)